MCPAERLSEVTSKKLAPGQATAIVTGGVSIAIGVSAAGFLHAGQPHAQKHSESASAENNGAGMLHHSAQQAQTCFACRKWVRHLVKNDGD